MLKFYLESLGCSKNQVDSEKISYILTDNNYIQVNNPEEADIIIVNTCSFIQKAKEESIEIIFELLKNKEIGICKKFIVAGCLAERYSVELKEQIPEIDLIFGIGDLTKIIEAINNNDRIVKPNYSVDNIYKRNLIDKQGYAYLKISDGCSNFCSYCSIPFIRGELRSRKIEYIIEEVKFLKTKKIKEFILVAQDTSNYGIDLYNKRMLGELILEIEKYLDKDDWLRVLYMHPDHITDELLNILIKSRNFIHYFDIPFQSGSNRILKLMNRKGTNEIYIKLLEKIRNIFPDSIIRSTFITGFPSETIDDYKETLNFINNAKLDWVGGFIYSREEKTLAYNMEHQINEKIKEKRLNNLIELSEQISYNNLKRFINSIQKVLIEEKIKKENLYIGRIFAQAPEVDGLTVIEAENLKIGQFYNIRIIKQNSKDFFGILEK